MTRTGALARGVHVTCDIGGVAVAVVDGGALLEAVGVVLVARRAFAAVLLSVESRGALLARRARPAIAASTAASRLRIASDGLRATAAVREIRTCAVTVRKQLKSIGAVVAQLRRVELGVTEVAQGTAILIFAGASAVPFQTRCGLSVARITVRRDRALSLAHVRIASKAFDAAATVRNRLKVGRARFALVALPTVAAAAFASEFVVTHDVHCMTGAVGRLRALQETVGKRRLVVAELTGPAIVFGAEFFGADVAAGVLPLVAARARAVGTIAGGQRRVAVAIVDVVTGLKAAQRIVLVAIGARATRHFGSEVRRANVTRRAFPFVSARAVAPFDAIAGDILGVPMAVVCAGALFVAIGISSDIAIGTHIAVQPAEAVRAHGAVAALPLVAASAVAVSFESRHVVGVATAIGEHRADPKARRVVGIASGARVAVVARAENITGCGASLARGACPFVPTGALAPDFRVARDGCCSAGTIRRRRARQVAIWIVLEAIGAHGAVPGSVIQRRAVIARGPCPLSSARAVTAGIHVSFHAAGIR